MKKLIVLLFISISQPALSQTLTPNTKCGETGVGLHYTNKTALRLSAEEAKGLQVGPDGVWRFCQAEKVEIKLDCAVPASESEWRVGERKCTAGTELPKSLADGQQVSVQAKQGAMRGVLVLACANGRLDRPVMDCNKATVCDTAIVLTRTEYAVDRQITRVYTYDARLPDKQLKLSEYAMATSPDGKTKEVQCVDGNLVEAVRPVVAPVVEKPVEVKRCNSQKVTAMVSGKYMPIYLGGGTAVGDKIERSGLTFVCGEDGRFVQP